LQLLQNEFGSVAIFYGSIFDLDKQKEVAADCFAGVYGGDAGLSVVHYMALGLPVLVHKEIHEHMGPEPDFVEDGVNGLLFERGNPDSLASKIIQLLDDDKMRHSMAWSALNTFNDLASPSMGEKMVNIMGLR